MNKKELIELMKDFEEISYDEYCERDSNEDIKIDYGVNGCNTIYLKKKQTFPIEIKTLYGKAKILLDGSIAIEDEDVAICSEELEEFEKIIKLAKQVRDSE